MANNAPWNFSIEASPFETSLLPGAVAVLCDHCQNITNDKYNDKCFILRKYKPIFSRTCGFDTAKIQNAYYSASFAPIVEYSEDHNCAIYKVESLKEFLEGAFKSKRHGCTIL
ncbi:MAG: hypothetical protein LBB21_06890 [Holosporaceae bacterium]|nr:hypothetical protein [Holosporaceae bacterium]